MSSRTPLRLNYELPANFIQRFRPVKAHAKEKGLQLYLFDLYGLRFYQRMATAGPLPDDAIWSVINPEGAELRLSQGFWEEAVGYVVAQRLPAPDDLHSFPLPIRLGYRAKVAVQALQRLREDLTRCDPLPNSDLLLALIDQRIDVYFHPSA